MKALGFAILALAASLSLVFVNVLKPNSLGAAAFFAAWLVLPYAALALALAFFANARMPAGAYAIVAALVGAGGLLFLTYAVFLNPDPQGAMAVLLTPVYQAIAFGLLVPACRWRMGRARG